GRLDLLPEAAAALLARERAAPHDLERDDAVELRLARLEDDSHAALGDALEQLVAGEEPLAREALDARGAVGERRSGGEVGRAQGGRAGAVLAAHRAGPAGQVRVGQHGEAVGARAARVGPDREYLHDQGLVDGARREEPFLDGRAPPGPGGGDLLARHPTDA